MVLSGKKLSSQELLKKNVLDTGLCTGCGACVSLCPYQVIYHDRTVQLHTCDLEDGKCHAFCPRTDVDLAQLRDSLFESQDMTPEIGSVKGYYFSRACDAQLREISQHGGTVTALMEVALTEGLIDSAIVSSRNQDISQGGISIKNKTDLRKNAGSQFTVSPTVAAFNKIASEDAKKIGVVATPCQALALTKMKLKSLQGDTNNIDKLEIVIGLYCGWTLSAEKFSKLLIQNKIDLVAITGMDIPAGKNILEIQTGNTIESIPFTDVQKCIREACSYCVDSTAEFADISVGSARFGSDWKEMRGWNQLIIRSKRGQRLVDLAIANGVLEIREAPAESLKELKNAAVEKKKAALKNIIRKSGSAKNLLYLDSKDPLIQRFLGKIK